MTQKYPKEIYNSIKQYSNGDFKTLSVEAFLFRDAMTHSLDQLRSPLMAEAYSRFRVSIFGKDGGVNANIRESEIDGIYEMSIACINASLSKPVAKDKQVPFKMGRFAGKTPAQVILEQGSANDVLSEKDYLAKNVSKFPANRAIMDAIDDAVTKFKAGALTDSGTAEVEIFNTGATRHIGKPDDNGMKKVYGIKISYFGDKFTIKIRNFKAPVITNESGQTIVKVKEAVDIKDMSFDLGRNEYLSLICKAKKTVDLFENYTFAKCWEMSERMQERERANG